MVVLFGTERMGEDTVPAAAVFERTAVILMREGRLFRDLHDRARGEAVHAARTFLRDRGHEDRGLVYVPAADDDAALVVHEGTAMLVRGDAAGAYVDLGMPNTARAT